MSFSWLSPDRQNVSNQLQPRNDFEVIEEASPQREVTRFQSIRQNLQDFRTKTDPNVAAGLGIEGAPVPLAILQQHRHHQQNITSSRSNSQNSQPQQQQQTSSTMQQLRPIPVASMMQPDLTNHNNSNNNNTLPTPSTPLPIPLPVGTVAQPPPIQNLGSSNTNYNYNQQQQQQHPALVPSAVAQASQAASHQNPQLQGARLPPTVVIADGSFRQGLPVHHLTNAPNEPTTVTLKSVTNPNAQNVVVISSSQNQNNTNNNNTETPAPNSTDISALSSVQQHQQQQVQHQQTVGRSLFGEHNNNNNFIPPTQSPFNSDGLPTPKDDNNKKVDTYDKPPWIGPMDQTPIAESASAMWMNQNTTTSSSPSASSKNNNRSGGRIRSSSSSKLQQQQQQQQTNESHHIQDGRKIIFKGNTRQRLLEETLYTGQSKIRFAWKQGADAEWGEGADFDDEGFQNIHNFNNAGGGFSAAESYEESYYHDVSNNNNNNNNKNNGETTTENENNNHSITPQTNKNKSNSNRKSSITPTTNRSSEPPILNLMHGTSVAAEQLRKARTEGERRTAKTLMKRQAWKALNPGAMDWQERTWQDTLRPSAKSIRGGAPTLDDAKHYTVLKNQRPSWRFPANNGPTMTELRHAPVVVNLSLEDLHLSEQEQVVLDYTCEQNNPKPDLHVRVAAQDASEQRMRNLHIGPKAVHTPAYSYQQPPANPYCPPETTPNTYSLIRPPGVSSTSRATSNSRINNSNYNNMNDNDEIEPPPSHNEENQSFLSEQALEQFANNVENNHHQHNNKKNITTTFSGVGGGGSSRAASSNSRNSSNSIAAAATSISLPPDRTNFSSKKKGAQWSASPVPLTPPTMNLMMNQNQRSSSAVSQNNAQNINQNSQNINSSNVSSGFVLPSRAARDAMITFADPNKSILTSDPLEVNKTKFKPGGESNNNDNDNNNNNKRIIGDPDL